MFLGAAALASFHIRVASGPHGIEEIILENAVCDFAKQFYTDAYRSAIEIVGGEQFILSAVMHADERNRAMSEALGRDVYHYHLHVVYTFLASCFKFSASCWENSTLPISVLRPMLSIVEVPPGCG